mgnify:CR=1 FL=1
MSAQVGQALIPINLFYVQQIKKACFKANVYGKQQVFLELLPHWFLGPAQDIRSAQSNWHPVRFKKFAIPGLINSFCAPQKYPFFYLLGF